jgi:hypothetical protein
MTTAHAKSFQSVVTSRFPATYLNIGDSSASGLGAEYSLFISLIYSPSSSSQGLFGVFLRF